MSLYVTQENQILLWNIISKNTLVSDHFNSNPTKKQDWFRSIIQFFYEQNRNRAIDTQTLLLLNKETISYMVQTIRDYNKTNTPQNFLKPYSITENKVEKIGNQYAEKQTEYNSLFEKKKPETIDFGEKQDAPLSNMDELIKQHMREREEELRKYAPQPLIPSQNNSVQKKLKIDDAPDNINIQIEELSDQESTRSKKSVSWSDDSNKEKIEAQQLEIDSLKAKVIELFDKISELEGKIKV
jgi:hypothetical protein